MKQSTAPKDGGYIFALTLSIMVIVSLLVLSSMQQILLFERATNKQQQTHRYFYELEHLMRQLILLPRKQLKTCTLYDNSANKVLQQLIAKQGCALKTVHANYYYLVEDLGNYSCHFIASEGRMHSSHHLRFSLVQEMPKKSLSLMQVRVAEAVSLLPCTRAPRFISAGIISWRYIRRWS